MHETFGQRLARLLQERNGGNQSELARAIGKSPQAIQQWIAGETHPRPKAMADAAAFLGVTPAYLAFADGPVSPPGAIPTTWGIKEPEEGHGKAIPYIEARGSCGGGSSYVDAEPRALIKESSWFSRYGVKPADAMVVYADGDSMADFIVDGDMAIFDKSKTAPKSGKIFLIEHPDGLRIKQLRREIDGTWVLESRNPDKRRFPDERIPPSVVDLLIIRGEFIYRQGGA